MDKTRIITTKILLLLSITISAQLSFEKIDYPIESLTGFYFAQAIIEANDKLYIGIEAQSTRGVFVSDDGGINWTKIDRSPDNFRVNVLNIDTNSTLWAGNESGLWKSNDGGINWEQQQLPIDDVSVSDIVINPENNEMFISTFSSPAKVFRTTDFGQNWTNLRERNFSNRLTKLGISPMGVLHLAFQQGSIVRFNEAINDLELIGEGGQRGVITDFTFNKNGTVIEAGTKGISLFNTSTGRFDINLDTDDFRGNASINTIAFDAVTQNIYAGGSFPFEESLYVSFDDGKNWEAVTDEVLGVDTGIRNIYIANNGTLYILGRENFYIGRRVGIDSDNDGISDEQDNCPLNQNPQQQDVDGDGAGTLCDCDESESTGSLCQTGCSTFYADLDGDGFGNPNDFITACAESIEYVINDLDCNDQDPLINPNAIDIPNNGIDEDCSGADFITIEPMDADDDGFNSSIDCNDNNPNIFPGAPEIPNNNIDEDCDGEDFIQPSGLYACELVDENLNPDVSLGYTLTPNELIVYFDFFNNITEESFRSFIPYITVDVNQNNLLDFQIDRQYTISNQEEVSICPLLAINFGNTISCANFVTEATVEQLIIPTSKNSVPHEVYKYTLPKSEIGTDTQANLIFNVDQFPIFPLNSSSLGFNMAYTLNYSEECSEFVNPNNTCATDLLFNSQSDIDNFDTNCQIIEGNVIINGDDITNLSNLNSIVEIRGSLIVGDSLDEVANDILETLTGLNSVRRIGGDLIVCNNPRLNSLAGLSSLEEVGGDIRVKNCIVFTTFDLVQLRLVGRNIVVFNCPSLVRFGSTRLVELRGGGLRIEGCTSLISLDGFSGLNFVSGDVYLIGNTSLTSVIEFRNLLSLRGCLHIIGNTSLTDLTGFTNLAETGDFRIENNQQLIDTDAFGNLQIVNGSFVLLNNNNLIDVTGFTNLTSVRDTFLVAENDILAVCCTFENLISNTNIVIVENNAVGCQSVAAIESDCELIENDADNDGIPDAIDCAPNDPDNRTAKGDLCDDGNTNTNNDTINDNCECSGEIIDNDTSQIALSCPTDLTIEAFLGEDRAMVSWELPTATTTCQTGGCTIDSLDGFDFMGVYNGNLYYLSEQPEYWLVAREIAQQNGGDLVVINDAAENRFITDAIGFNGSVLIGLTDMETEGKFNWVDGTDLNYTNWEDGQPNNFMDIDRPENEDYAALHGWSRGQWADYNFYTQKHFVVEIECGTGIQSVVNLEQTTGGNNGTFFSLGTTQITYRATDNCGADTTCVFNVTVAAGREQCDATTNLALGQPVRQSSTQDGAEASRAVDGNTNGILFENSDPLPTGSVTQTQWEQSPWWEIDLGELYQISEIKLFNRTDCCSDFLQDFYILASPEPFLSDDLSTNLTQAGVVSYYQETAVGENATIGLNQAGRYVRIQLRDQGALSLAEIEILGCVGNGLRVNGGASQVNFGGYLNEENVVQLYAQNYAPIGAERLVIEKMDTDINFQTLSESVENNAARQSIIYQTTDEQPYEGDNYYRLKVLYQNGTFEYSPVVNVPFNPVSDFTVFPNPTSDYVDVYLKRFKNQDFNLLIINHLGIEINRFDFTNQQERFVRLDTSDLQDGLYFITIIRNGKTETRRLIIQKM